MLKRIFCIGSATLRVSHCAVHLLRVIEVILCCSIHGVVLLMCFSVLIDCMTVISGRRSVLSAGRLILMYIVNVSVSRIEQIRIVLQCVLFLLIILYFALHQPRTHRRTVGDRAFAAAGPTLWNSLPHDIADCVSLTSFCLKRKTSLFSISFP